MRCTILAGHQRQVEHLATGQGSTYAQTGPASLFRIYIILCDGDGFIHR